MNASMTAISGQGEAAAALASTLPAIQGRAQGMPQGSREIRQVEPVADLRLCLAACETAMTAEAPEQSLDPAAIRARLGQPFPINFYASGQSPLEGLVPDPPTPVPAGFLERDPWLAGKCKEPGYLEAFGRLLAQRCAREERGEEFCLPQLKVTLRNMCRFIDYMCAGKQFAARLTEKDQRALSFVRETACQLEALDAPYRRTVYLSLALMSLYEIITDRQVFEPLEQARPEAFERHVARVRGWSCGLESGDPGEEGRVLQAAELDPLKVAALNWGGNNPDSPDGPFDSMASQEAFGMKQLWASLGDQLCMQHLLLYPSFEALEVADFCRFGHLGLHPVGLITQYALNADGTMNSPLAFARHDVSHIRFLEDVGAPSLQSTLETDLALCRRDRRLGWRCLVLDQLPARLACLAPALEVLVFHLFHEIRTEQAVTHYLEHPDSPFVRCLGRIARVRRHERNGYASDYQAITDREAAMATLWALRLWRSWQAADCRALTAAELEAFAQTFVAQDLPRLQAHLDFVERHWPALRQWFADVYGCDTTEDDGLIVRGDPEVKRFLGLDTLFARWHADSGLSHLDYTDIGYFFALHSPGLCQQMADTLGTALPCREVLSIAPFESSAVDR